MLLCKTNIFIGGKKMKIKYQIAIMLIVVIVAIAFYYHSDTSSSRVWMAAQEDYLERSIGDLNVAVGIENKDGHPEIAAKITDIKNQMTRLLADKKAWEKEKNKKDTELWFQERAVKKRAESLSRIM